MTEITHCVVGASITITTTQVGKAIGGVSGESIGYIAGLCLSLVSHLMIDRRVFEWGFWYNRGDPLKQIIGASDIIAGWATQLILFYLLTRWVILHYINGTIFTICVIGGSIMGALPDLAETIAIIVFGRNKYQFPYHQNFQTPQNTLTAWKTAITEGQIAILSLLIAGTMIYLTRRIK